MKIETRAWAMTPVCGRSRPAAFIFAAALAGLTSSGARAVEFSIDFADLPDRVGGNPGEAVTIDGYMAIKTADNEFPGEGLQGWSFGITAEGADFVADTI